MKRTGDREDRKKAEEAGASSRRPLGGASPFVPTAFETCENEGPCGRDDCVMWEPGYEGNCAGECEGEPYYLYCDKWMPEPKEWSGKETGT